MPTVWRAVQSGMPCARKVAGAMSVAWFGFGFGFGFGLGLGWG